MSADNWTICPRCIKRAQREHAESVAAVMATYGKVPVEEFDAARAAIPEPMVKETFREDYAFYGAEDGMVTASYSGHCQECYLGLDFKVERTLFPAGSDEGEGAGSDGA